MWDYQIFYTQQTKACLVFFAALIPNLSSLMELLLETTAPGYPSDFLKKKILQHHKRTSVSKRLWASVSFSSVGTFVLPEPAVGWSVCLSVGAAESVQAPQSEDSSWPCRVHWPADLCPPIPGTAQVQRAGLAAGSLHQGPWPLQQSSSARPDKAACHGGPTSPELLR